MSLILPTLEQQKHIKKVLKEDSTNPSQDLEAIREWLRKQPHLPDTFDDRRLMSFLRGSKFSLEKCKKKLELYFTVRSMIPEFFQNRDVVRPELQQILSYGFLFVLPTMTPDGKRVYLAGTTTTDFDTPDIANVFKFFFMLRDVLLEKEHFGSVGDIYLIDASVVIPKHLFKVPPSVLKKYIICNLEAYPTLLKEVHIVNATPFIDILLNIFKPFLKEKIWRRIHIHPTLVSVYEYVPRRMLPEEYGGTAGKLKDYKDQTVKMLAECTAWFKEQDSVVADKSKRPGKSYDYEDVFGMDGTFRKLNVD